MRNGEHCAVSELTPKRLLNELISFQVHTAAVASSWLHPGSYFYGEAHSLTIPAATDQHCGRKTTLDRPLSRNAETKDFARLTSHPVRG